MSERDDLIARATELGCFERPEERTDQQLRDAIAAEEAAADWMGRLDSLPTEDAQRDAIRRLREHMLPPEDQPPRTRRYLRGPTGNR